MVSEENLRRTAHACLANAEALHKEAEFLDNHGFHARAAALAVIGGEEFAKSVAYTAAALLHPGKDDIPGLLRRLRSHEVKHVIQSSAEAVQIETEEAYAIAFWDLGHSPSNEEWLVDLFIGLTTVGLSGLIASRDDARKFYQRLQGPIRGLTGTPGILDLKDAALYVDLTDSGKILSPARIDHRLSSSEIAGLGWFLEQFQGLAKVLADDSEWARFLAILDRRQAQPKETPDE